MGTKDGSIIATIITTHMPRNDAAAPGHVCPGIRIHAIAIVQPPGIGISPIADMPAHQTIVTTALAAKSSAETPKKVCWDARSEAMGREISPPAVCANDTHDVAQRWSYSSWRRHQTPVSLRPLGARSSHWYMPQRPSTPRSYAEYVWYTTPSSSTNALIPGPSCRYVGQSVPTLDVSWVMKGSLSPDTGSRKSIERKLYSTAPAAHSSLVCVTWKS